MMEYIFLAFLFMTIYPYLIYPLLVNLWSRLAGRAWEREVTRPQVSMVISVFNEERVIREKIMNALSLEYPLDLLEIIIVSDGSTDQTNQIVSSIEDPRLVLVASPERKGKTACLNLTVPTAKGDIVIFTDANSMFPRDLVLKITRHFFSDRIGLVTGWTKYRKPGGEEETSGLYARLERVTKFAEGNISSCVGADGAVFALRKNLYRPLRDDDINDFVIPLHVIGQGKRVVLDPDVYCVEQPPEGELKQFRRQVRITNRTLGAIWRNIRFLNPVVFKSFAFFLLSHKILRFLAPFFSLGSFLLALILAGGSVFYAAFAVAQIIFIGIGTAGIFKLSGRRYVQLCSFILLTFFAQLIGWSRCVAGKTDIVWNPER